MDDDFSLPDEIDGLEDLADPAPVPVAKSSTTATAAAASTSTVKAEPEPSKPFATTSNPPASTNDSNSAAPAAKPLTLTIPASSSSQSSSVSQIQTLSDSSSSASMEPNASIPPSPAGSTTSGTVLAASSPSKPTTPRLDSNARTGAGSPLLRPSSRAMISPSSPAASAQRRVGGPNFDRPSSRASDSGAPTVDRAVSSASTRRSTLKGTIDRPASRATGGAPSSAADRPGSRTSRSSSRMGNTSRQGGGKDDEIDEEHSRHSETSAYSDEFELADEVEVEEPESEIEFDEPEEEEEDEDDAQTESIDEDSSPAVGDSNNNRDSVHIEHDEDKGEVDLSSEPNDGSNNNMQQSQSMVIHPQTPAHRRPPTSQTAASELYALRKGKRGTTDIAGEKSLTFVFCDRAKDRAASDSLRRTEKLARLKSEDEKRQKNKEDAALKTQQRLNAQKALDDAKRAAALAELATKAEVKAAEKKYQLKLEAKKQEGYSANLENAKSNFAAKSARLQKERTQRVQKAENERTSRLSVKTRLELLRKSQLIHQAQVEEQLVQNFMMTAAQREQAKKEREMKEKAEADDEEGSNAGEEKANEPPPRTPFHPPSTAHSSRSVPLPPPSPSRKNRMLAATVEWNNGEDEQKVIRPKRDLKAAEKRKQAAEKQWQALEKEAARKEKALKKVILEKQRIYEGKVAQIKKLRQTPGDDNSTQSKKSEEEEKSKK